MCYQEEMSVFNLGSGCCRPDEANWCRFSAYFNQMVGVFPFSLEYDVPTSIAYALTIQCR